MSDADEMTCPAYEVQPPATIELGGATYTVVDSRPSMVPGDWWILAKSVTGPASLFLQITDDAPLTIRQTSKVRP